MKTKENRYFGYKLVQWHRANDTVLSTGFENKQNARKVEGHYVHSVLLKGLFTGWVGNTLIFTFLEDFFRQTIT